MKKYIDKYMCVHNTCMYITIGCYCCYRKCYYNRKSIKIRKHSMGITVMLEDVKMVYNLYLFSISLNLWMEYKT